MRAEYICSITFKIRRFGGKFPFESVASDGRFGESGSRVVDIGGSGGGGGGGGGGGFRTELVASSLSSSDMFSEKKDNIMFQSQSTVDGNFLTCRHKQRM